MPESAAVVPVALVALVAISAACILVPMRIDWAINVLDALTLIVTAIIAVVSVWLILRELAQNRAATQLQSLLHLFDNLSSPQARRNRKFVQLELGDKKWADLTDDERERLVSVWVWFDNLALLRRSNYVDDNEVNMWRDTIVSCYRKSKRQLEEFRSERAARLRDSLSKEDAERYMIYFEQLAQKIGSVDGQSGNRSDKES